MERVRRVELPTLCWQAWSEKKGPLMPAPRTYKESSIRPELIRFPRENGPSRKVTFKTFSNLKKCNVARLLFKQNARQAR
jgi:hypothetical protein